MKYRKYQPDKHKKAVRRIWKEIGWLSKENYDAMDIEIENSKTIVKEINGEAETLVSSVMGDYNYNGNNLNLSAIIAVTTSLVARKKGYAGKLTAQKIAEDAKSGAEICGLGMFEQGYYDRLGFGSIGYQNWIQFCPENLNIKINRELPKRYSFEDYVRIHESRINRIKKNGALNLPEHITKAGLKFNEKKSLVLGYENDKGDITHHFLLRDANTSHGPVMVDWMAYRNYEQFRDLLGLLKSFEDQIFAITMPEPPLMQFQDFLDKPFRNYMKTAKSKYKFYNNARANHQFRILNIFKCIEKTSVRNNVKFNLELNDPIKDFFDDDAEWKGISGEYVIELGENSRIKKGIDNRLPKIKTNVNNFTRMWMGVLPASVLQIYENFEGDEKLIKKLDDIFNFHKPCIDWGF